MADADGNQGNLSGGPLRTALFRTPPPLVYVAVFLIGVGINALLPVPRIPGELEGLREWTGVATPALGVLLGPVNASMFLVRGTTLNPVGSPRRLFTGGVYRISRDPMYLGLLMIYAGIALVRWQVWALLMIVIPFLVVDRIYIPAEEQRMSEAFGAPYERYRLRVRRWLGIGPESSHR